MGTIMIHATWQALVNTTMQEPSTSYNDTNIPPSMAAKQDTLDPHLIRHPFLASLNLIVNAEFHFLVCQLCKEAIVTPTTRSHIVNKHPELLSAFSLERFQTVTAELRLTPSLPTNITGPRSVVHGLAVCDAFACQHCPTVMTKHKKMREHHSQNHQDQPIPNTWRSCKAQRMKAEGAGSQRTFWEIASQPTAELDHVMKQLMNNLEGQLENVVVPTDHRLVTPWLHMTRWHEYVANSGLSIDWLRRSIMPPQKNEIDCKNIHRIVESYFRQALDLLDRTDELVLQRINSPDPIKW